MDNTTKGGLAVGVLLLGMLLGNAITGALVIGYHAECIDGIDNNEDGLIDGMDSACSEYPYADGNGEDFTPMEDRMNKDSYLSLFEYHRDYMQPMSQEQIDTICAYILIQPGGYEEPDTQNGIEWTIENNVNCEMHGP